MKDKTISIIEMIDKYKETLNDFIEYINNELEDIPMGTKKRESYLLVRKELIDRLEDANNKG